MKTRHISRRFRRFAKANEAVSALEYAILVGVVTIGVGAAILAFSDNIQEAIKAIGTDVQRVGGTVIADGDDLSGD